MMRNLLLCCGVLGIALLGAYTTSTRETPADFTYVNPSGIHTLDPARMSWTPDFRVALNIWEGLTSWDPRTLAPIAGAAQFPPKISPDGLVYTFTIRPDARWSNGDPVTSADFVRGWRRGLEPGTATDYTFLIADNVVGADDYVAWRRRGVGALTALARLRDGWGLGAAQVRALGAHEVWARLQASSATALLRARVDRDAADWESLAQAVSALPIDFGALYDDIFRQHVEEMPSRFEAVGLRAASERELQVHLVNPCPFFLDMTGFPIFLPCHKSIERLRRRYRESPITEEGLVVYDPQWTKPDYHAAGYPGLITNGPYRLSDWTFKRRARLVVNEHYHHAADIACRIVDMVVYENVSAAMMAYEAGDVDFLPDMSVPYEHELARLAREGLRPDFHACMVLATYFFNFNCRDATVRGRRNPFVDRRVRKAFALALDREAIVNQVIGRGDRVARSFVPPDAMLGYQPPEGLAHDPREARRLMAECGYVDGREFPVVELLYTPNDQLVVQAAARMWQDALGVAVELRGLESKTFAQEKAKRRYTIARGNWYADYNDPTTFLDCLSTDNGNNDSGYSNRAYDDLLGRARRERDPGARFELLRQAEAMIVEDDLPILPVLHYTSMLAIQPDISGLIPNARLWFPFRYVRNGSHDLPEAHVSGGVTRR